MKAEQLDPVAPATCRLSRGRPALGASSATQASRFSGAVSLPISSITKQKSACKGNSSNRHAITPYLPWELIVTLRAT
jgi:hypothetical protein